jgi:TusA-related sulfurtransferase
VPTACEANEGGIVTSDVVLDCLGRPCPVPVIELARAVAAARVGSVVEVVSDDPAAALDVPAWCRMRGQEYLGETARDAGVGYRVRRLV